jgi:hypothetical protein
MAIDFRRMQQLRGSSVEWGIDDIVPLAGEMALETGGAVVRAKVGDGTSLYSVLPYAFEVDITARSSITDLEADFVTLESRVDAIEGGSGSLSDLQDQVDINTAAIAGKQATLAAGTSVGGILFWDGSAYVAAGTTMFEHGILYYDDVAEDYLCTAEPTAWQILQADATGKPAWSTTLKVPTISALGIAGLDDTNTGLSLPAADTLALVTGGTDRVTVSAGTDVCVTGASQDSTVRFAKDETGEVYIDTFLTSTPATKHTLNLNKFGGTVLINDAVIVSAEELKFNITPLGSALDGLLQIPVVCYDRGAGTRGEIGILAGDVQKQFEIAANVKGERAAGFYLSDMLAVTMRAVQELALEVRAMRG